MNDDGQAVAESVVLSLSAIRNLIDALPYYVLLVDEDHYIVLANKALTDVLGLDPDNVVGCYCPKVIHQTDHAFPGCPLEDARITGGGVERELYDADKDLWLLSAVYPIPLKTAAGKQIYFHTAHDISERKRAEESLRVVLGQLEVERRRMEELAKKTIEAQENERLYLASEIHDDLLQGLVATSYFVQSIDPATLSAELKKRRQTLIDVLSATIEKGRTLLREIGPISEPETGLIQAIQQSIELRFDDPDIEVDFAHPDDLPGLSLADKTNILRICQEGLMNVRKHAKATKVRVTLAALDDRLEIAIEDNGVGVEPDSIPGPERGHYGFLTMRERARLVGGDLTVESEPGKWTVVKAILPLKG